jgi:hypothetical protein
MAHLLKLSRVGGDTILKPGDGIGNHFMAIAQVGNLFLGTCNGTI